MTFLLYFSITALIILRSLPPDQPRGRRGLAIAVVFVIACPVAQTLRKDRVTYPFVAWTITPVLRL